MTRSLILLIKAFDQGPDNLVRTRFAQGMYFRMRLAGTQVPAFGNDLPLLREHAADAGVGRGAVQTAARQAQRTGHAGMIKGAEAQESRRSFLAFFSSREICR